MVGTHHQWRFQVKDQYIARRIDVLQILLQKYLVHERVEESISMKLVPPEMGFLVHSIVLDI